MVDVNFPQARSYNVFQVNKKVEDLEDMKVRERLAELKGKYKSIFGELTPEKFVRLGGPATIHMRPPHERTKPYKARTARRLARALQEKSRKLLRDLEKSGVIR